MLAKVLGIIVYIRSLALYVYSTYEYMIRKLYTVRGIIDVDGENKT